MSDDIEDYIKLSPPSLSEAAKDSTAVLRVLADKTQDDRVIAVTALAYIQDYLGRLIRRRMPGLTSEVKDHLFGSMGYISNMAAMIDIAKAMAILSAKNRSELIAMNRIRNRLAHEIHVDFSTPKIVELSGKLDLYQELLKMKPPTGTERQMARERFAQSATLYIMILNNIEVRHIHNESERAS